MVTQQGTGTGSARLHRALGNPQHGSSLPGAETIDHRHLQGGAQLRRQPVQGSGKVSIHRVRRALPPQPTRSAPRPRGRSPVVGAGPERWRAARRRSTDATRSATTIHPHRRHGKKRRCARRQGTSPATDRPLLRRTATQPQQQPWRMPTPQLVERGLVTPGRTTQQLAVIGFHALHTGTYRIDTASRFHQMHGHPHGASADAPEGRELEILITLREWCTLRSAAREHDRLSPHPRRPLPVLPQCCPSPIPRETTKGPLPAFLLVRTPFRICTPDGIRTRATALRGRRARPLHNGGQERTRLYRPADERVQSVRRWGTRTRT